MRVELEQAARENPVHGGAIAEAEADPEAGFFGAADEMGAVEPSGDVVEILDKADRFDVGIGDDGEISFLGEELNSDVGLEAGRLDKAVERFPVKA